MSSRVQSAIVGACVFGTSDGFTMRGVGCLSAETRDLRRELDMQSYKVEREEAFWFCVPVWVDKVEARLIGKTSYARDLSHRDGNAGAAVVAPASGIAKAGFSGAMRYAEDLHERFLRSCLDPRSQVLAFQRAPEALRPLSFLQPSSARLSFFGKRPQRLKLPRSWPTYASMPELFRLASSAEALNPADTSGFVLREVDSAQADIRIEEALLASWYDALYGSDQRQRLERERDEARNAWRSEQVRRTELERAVEANEARLRGAQETVDSLKAAQRDLQKQIKETTEASAAQLRNAQATINSVKDAQARFEADKQEYLSRINDWERAYNGQEKVRLQLDGELRSWHKAHEVVALSHPDVAARISDLVGGRVRAEVPAPPRRPFATILTVIALVFLVGVLAFWIKEAFGPAKPSDPPDTICGLAKDIGDQLEGLEGACGEPYTYSHDAKSCSAHQALIESTRNTLLNCPAAKRCAGHAALKKAADDYTRVRAISTMLGCLRK